MSILKALNQINRLIEIMLSRTAFVIASVGLTVYVFVGLLLLDSFGGVDYWEHLAAIYAFARNPINPDNPYLATNDPTHLFTPYHLVWGLLARAMHVHPFYLFPLIGAVNMLLFGTAVWQVARHIVGDQRYALPFALTLLFFWYRPLGWSGFYHFGLLPLTAVYPYWFAFPVSLIVIALYGGHHSKIWMLTWIPILPLVFLIHPLTGTFLLVTLSAKVLTLQGYNLAQKALLLTIPIVAFSLSLLWPYFPVREAVFGLGSFHDLDFAGDAAMFYEQFWQRILPAFLGIPFLLGLFYRRRLNFVGVGFSIVTIIYVLNYYTLYNSALARYVIFVAFFLHLAIIMHLKAEENSLFRPLLAMAFVVVLLFFGSPQTISSIRWIGVTADLQHGTHIGYHSNLTRFKTFASLARWLRTSDVVIAPPYESWILPGITGSKVVDVLHANPFFLDFSQRRQDAKRFFDETASTAERLAILDKYRITAVLIPRELEDSHLGPDLPLTLLYQTSEYAIYSVQEE